MDKLRTNIAKNIATTTTTQTAQTAERRQKNDVELQRSYLKGNLFQKSGSATE